MEIRERIVYEFDGKDVLEYELNCNGLVKVCILNYGGIISRIFMDDVNENQSNIVLGTTNYEDFIHDNGSKYGALVGPHAGRIKGAKYTLDNVEYKLSVNNGESNLHSGDTGFADSFFDVETEIQDDKLILHLTQERPDGTSGFPGNVSVKIDYILTNKNEFYMNYEIISDKKTIINPTNHGYFNLNVDPSLDVSNHLLTMDADRFVEIDGLTVPTGKLLNVDGTCFDFREGALIANAFNNEYQQVAYNDGFDHPIELVRDKKLVLYSDESKREIEMETDMEAVVMYTYNYPQDNELCDKENKVHMGVALEFQNLPGGINIDGFPDSVYDANEVFKRYVKYTFSIRR